MGVKISYHNLKIKISIIVNCGGQKFEKIEVYSKKPRLSLFFMIIISLNGFSPHLRIKLIDVNFNTFQTQFMSNKKEYFYMCGMPVA